MIASGMLRGSLLSILPLPLRTMYLCLVYSPIRTVSRLQYTCPTTKHTAAAPPSKPVVHTYICVPVHTQNIQIYGHIYCFSRKNIQTHRYKCICSHPGNGTRMNAPVPVTSAKSPNFVSNMNGKGGATHTYFYANASPRSNKYGHVAIT